MDRRIHLRLWNIEPLCGWAGGGRKDRGTGPETAEQAPEAESKHDCQGVTLSTCYFFLPVFLFLSELIQLN